MTNKDIDHTLGEIREIFEEVEKKRLSPDITTSERSLLELSSTALRSAEKAVTLSLQKKMAKELGEATEQIRLYSIQIRARVTRINKASKIVDTIESVIKTLTKILSAIAKW